jgi:hypothetical protein
MVVAIALAAFGAGLLVGLAMKGSAAAGLGSSWEEWRGDGGRRRWPLLQVGVAAATAIGIYGLGAPAAVRAGLLAAIAGFCVPFMAEGLRRYWRARRAALRGERPMPTWHLPADDDELTGSDGR